MTILAFTAVWCPKCLIMRPRLEDIARERADVIVTFIDIDTEQAHPLLEQHQVAHPPVFLFCDDAGNVLERRGGELSRRELTAIIDQYTSSP